MTTYVPVHGGFVGGWYWGETAALLEKAGRRVHIAEQMPSIDPTVESPGGLHADAEYVRAIVGLAAQEQMAARAEHVERLPSSHQPMLSMPDRLAEVFGRIG